MLRIAATRISVLAQHATRMRRCVRLRSSRSAGGDFTFEDLKKKGFISMPVKTAIALAGAFFTAVGVAIGAITYASTTKANNTDAALRLLELKALTESVLLDDIEEQRKVIYRCMSDMSKPSLKFDLKPRNTKAVNNTFKEAIDGALRVPGIPVRILCVPPGYGKSYALCGLLKELKKKGVISGAEIVRGDQSFLDDTVDLDAWLLERLGVKEKRHHDLQSYFMKPKDAVEEEKDLPYYIVFDQLDKVRLHPFFEDFILRLKDIGLRHKNVRFLVSTHEPLVAEQIRAMNGNEKIRFGRFFVSLPFPPFSAFPHPVPLPSPSS